MNKTGKLDLTEREKVFLDFRFNLGMSLKEVAEKMGIENHRTLGPYRRNAARKLGAPEGINSIEFTKFLLRKGVIHL